MNKPKLQEQFVEKGADIEHQRWANWQSWCHKVLRENCPSPELEKVLERWERQIATPYKDLSEQEKESDRKEARTYLPLLDQALKEQKEGIIKMLEPMSTYSNPENSEYKAGFLTAKNAAIKTIKEITNLKK